MKDFFLYVRKRIREGILHEMLGELKWIYRWSMHYRGAIVWYICLGIFSTWMGLGVGVVSKYIIDAVTGYDSGGLLPAAIGYGAMSLFQIGMTAWSGRVSEKIRIMVNQEIRLDVFNKVLMSDWQSLSRFHSGDLLNRLNGDVNTVASSVIGWIPNMVTGLVRFFATLALILYYDPTMAALALLGRVFTGGMAGFFDGLIGGLLCGFFLFIPFLMKSAGGGDVKMLFAAGIVVGLRFSFVELLFVSVSGLVLGVVMLCFGLVGSRRLIHYARVLFDWRYDRKKGAAGLPPKQDEKGRIPFGVAIASGTLATLIYSFLLEVH